MIIDFTFFNENLLIDHLNTKINIITSDIPFHHINVENIIIDMNGIEIPGYLLMVFLPYPITILVKRNTELIIDDLMKSFIENNLFENDKSIVHMGYIFKRSQVSKLNEFIDSIKIFDNKFFCLNKNFRDRLTTMHTVSEYGNKSSLMQKLFK